MPTDPAHDAARHTAVPPFADPFAWTADVLRSRRTAGLLRTLTPRPADSALLDLAGNDYLGLSRHPEVTSAAARAARRWGAGAGGSRLVTGTTELHAELEAELAGFCGFEAALVLSSGYAANLAAVTACTADPAGPGLLVSDARNHASLIDGCRLSRARTAVAAHADPEAVAKALAARAPGESALVVTDSVFSVDGDAAPLGALAAVCAEAGAGLLVDDAHGLGVLGEGGRGALCAAGLAGAQGTVATVTLSKALGSQGGAVLGPAHVIAHLVNSARTVIFDTGLAPAAAGAALGALRLLRREPERAARTRAVAAAVHGRLSAAGLDATRPDAAVVAVRAPSARAALAWAAALRAVGVQVGCFRPPSVPDGVSRLRLTARGDLDGAALARAVDAVIATAPSGG
ncbi:aminotransferase class I/II-fold pyridoxal phosphate-dependent enzyme [Streptomyces tubbatahanensis]|uniref:8-amino-7-oxononanoate synthase n=1 Tax=Streptomyces tubbatahanensis TaxID=2923272 RepID=A0ABY3XMK4_9ACTN|nr:aminotransferase class I/II-fold pyridoxal phosphate-dependent enzyme [Streptomyces tubbatahanensis]UNS95666.1 aminotransferase class I/II-fold pyridoxal phosphate-dependent enzyme [Streptomyces tubbatahanensis]